MKVSRIQKSGSSESRTTPARLSSSAHGSLSPKAKRGKQAKTPVSPDSISNYGTWEVHSFFSRSGGRTRTYNKLVNSQLLCRLSYTGPQIGELGLNHKKTYLSAFPLTVNTTRHSVSPHNENVILPGVPQDKFHPKGDLSRWDRRGY